MRVGIRVECATCGQQKKPIGRSQPFEASYCTQDSCSGYFEEPYPGSLWPGESEAEFGYAVCRNGTVDERDEAVFNRLREACDL